MDIEKITTTEGLAELGSVWDNLLEKNATYAPFLTHGWVNTWWQILGKQNGNRLFILVGREDNKIVGIAPLMLSRKKLGIRRLEFMADENSSRFDFIVSPTSQDRFFETLSDYLYGQRYIWDECVLNYFPCISKNYETIQEKFVQKGFKVGENFFQAPYIILEKSWEEFLSRRDKKFRANFKNNFRKVERENMICRMASADDNFDEVIKKVFEVERNSWKQKNGTAITSKKEMEEFYKEVVIHAWKRGRLYLGLMEKEGKPVAYDLNWAEGDAVFSLKMGFDEKYRNLGVGKVLFGYTVKKSFEDGYKYHELMGLDEDFKMDWTEEVRPHSRFHFYNQLLKSRWLYFYNFKMKKLKKFLKAGKPTKT